MLSRVVSAPWIMLMTGLLAVACAVYLGALERLADGASGWKKLWKALGVVLLIGGAAELIGAAAGSNDLLQPLRGVGGGDAVTAPSEQGLAFRRIKSLADAEQALAAAKSAGQPAMLDFYADWCVSCKEMEKFTFTDARVKQALAGFVLLQADVTANDDTDKALMKHFEIVGPPDTVFYDADGKQRHDLQLVGAEKPADFMQRVGGVRR
jgi:thiol:disulfide interchange protein DsbD